MADRIVCNLTFDEIKELAELVAEKKLGKIDIKVQDSHIVIEDKKCPPVLPPLPSVMPAAVQALPSQANAVSEPETAPAASKEKLIGNIVKAPIVGTFYAAPSPDRPPFVKTGQKVRKGDVLFIIESMKLMNEIQSEFDGVVKKIFVSDATAVEYDQPIMVIE